MQSVLDANERALQQLAEIQEQLQQLSNAITDSNRAALGYLIAAGGDQEQPDDTAAPR